MFKRGLLLASVATGLFGPAPAFALKAVLDSVDDLPEDVKNEYVEQNGKYVLQVEGMKSQTDYDRLLSAHNKEKSEHGSLKQRITSVFGDKKFEDVQTMLDRIPELEAAAEGKLDDDKINNIVEGRVKTRLAPVERELTAARARVGELEGAVGELTTKEKRRKIRDEVRAAGKRAGVTDEAIDDALLLGDNIFEIREDDGKVVVKEGTSYTSGIEPSVLFTDLQSKKPHWFGPSGGGGAGGNRGGGSGSNANPYSKAGWNMTEQGRIYSADPAKAEQLAKAAGLKSALGATKPAEK